MCQRTDLCLAVTITYIPYMLVEIPSNLLLKKVGPKIALPLMCTSWGIVTTLQSQVKSFGGLVACRFFLGFCEGGLFPGMILHLSSFYRRSELQIRIAIFFTAVSLSGAFSGLLAAAIQQLDGRGGLAGWSWIFLLEGLFTVLWGIFSFFMLPNDAHGVRTFKPEHVEQCLRRLEEDSNDFQHQKVTLKEMLSIFKEVHVLLSLPFYFATGALGFGLSVFSPTIIKSLGYSSTITQLLTVPPYVMAFIATVITAYVSDRFQMRGITAAGAGLIALAGSVIMYKGRGFGVRYAGICLLVTGAYSNAPSLLTWLPNNTAGYTRRATAVAMMAIMTSCGGMVSMWIYPTSSAPYFAFGAKFNIALICIMEVLIVVLILWLRRLNRLKEERPEELLRGVENLNEEEQFNILGDRHPKYKYCY